MLKKLTLLLGTATHLCFAAEEGSPHSLDPKNLDMSTVEPWKTIASITLSQKDNPTLAYEVKTPQKNAYINGISIVEALHEEPLTYERALAAYQEALESITP